MKKRLMGMAVASVLAIGSIAGVGTYAYFNDTETSSGNTIQAGTLQFSGAREDMPITGPMFYTNTSSSTGVRGTGLWQPGKFVSRTLLLENDGSLNAKLKSVKANLTATNADAAAQAMFGQDMILTTLAIAGGNLAYVEDQLEAKSTQLQQWLAAHPGATENQKLAKMNQLWNSVPWAYGTVTSQVHQAPLADYLAGNVDLTVNANVGKTVAVVYWAYLQDDGDQNILQGKEFNFDFVHEFVQQ